MDLGASRVDRCCCNLNVRPNVSIPEPELNPDFPLPINSAFLLLCGPRKEVWLGMWWLVADRKSLQGIVKPVKPAAGSLYWPNVLVGRVVSMHRHAHQTLSLLHIFSHLPSSPAAHLLAQEHSPSTLISSMLRPCTCICTLHPAPCTLPSNLAGHKTSLPSTVQYGCAT